MSFADKADAPANRDIREGWFSFSGGRLTANLRLALVDQQLEPGDGSASFVMYYGNGGTPRYASATTNGTTWSFTYGDDNGSTVTGATTGAVRPGPNGVIEIVVPRVHAGEGDTVRNIHARTFTRDAVNVTGSQTDGAPDGSDPKAFGGYGANFLVAPCPAPQPEPGPGPGGGPEPPAEPGQPSPAPPIGEAPGTAPQRAPFTVTVPRLRARSLERNRSFRVVVDPSAPVRGLVVTLRRNGRVVARGRRASLTRAAGVKVTVTRRIRRGAHRLRISGSTPSGRVATGAVTARVR